MIIMYDENRILSERQKIISELTATRIEKGLSQQALADMVGTKRANISEYAKTRTNPYGVSYDTICKEIMEDRQRRRLLKLIGFTFTRHPAINLPRTFC